MPRELRDGEADALSESDSTSQPWARDPSKKRGEKILINHSIQVVKQAAPRLRLRWAALLHDVGKPRTVKLVPEGLQFHRHEEVARWPRRAPSQAAGADRGRAQVGAEMTAQILGAYGYPQHFIREVATLVKRSGRIRMVNDFRDAGLRRVLLTIGPLYDDLLDLYQADCTSMQARMQMQHQSRAVVFSRRIREVQELDRVASLRPPLSGNDIMRITGLREGFELGLIVRPRLGPGRVRLVRGEGRGVSDWYGVRDAACPISTG